MTETTTTPETVSVELNVEVAYQQLVGFQQAVVDYNKADAEDNDKGRVDAANNAVNASLLLINDIMPGDLSEKLHARLAEEHPDLVPEPAFDLAEVLKQLGLLDDESDIEES
jgi:hypothetical protein